MLAVVEHILQYGTVVDQKVDKGPRSGSLRACCSRRLCFFVQVRNVNIPRHSMYAKYAFIDPQDRPSVDIHGIQGVYGICFATDLQKISKDRSICGHRILLYPPAKLI